uniref:Probable serine/threonine-protein kinase DDB_G0282963 isoform X2 n=1 Tax=Dermatophagoides pteronyssinus TaxID=6956 RepID=A0A6P6XMF5_DERPT|nr:probable serine/threonine-protein kinase DDB_G0282963 isoform X2 [Dermatophagoides pteronyssinus]
MAKIHEANIRKLYLKVFAEDDSSKCLLADERMQVGRICQQMAEKNHISIGINYCIIEHMPQLYLERFYEDHESLVENVLYWGRDHHNLNKLYFVQQPDKYDMFIQPEKYLISVNQSNENVDTLKSGSLRAKYNANQLRTDLIGQFFSNNNNNNVRVPEIEGNLFLRSDGKKVWKKYFFSLRSSGLYYCPKGRPKSTKDLICLTTFELNCVYYGFGWRKKFKAPNDYGFAIKHPQIQTKSPKHIKYLCAESQDDLKLWMTGIRIAKYGHHLLENYKQFKMNSDELSSSVDDDGTTNGDDILNKKITTFPMNDSTNNDHHHYNYGHEESNHIDDYDHHHNIHNSNSIQMRINRIPRSESIRSSSASSSSGCISEQNSIVSTPSSSSSSGSSSGSSITTLTTNGHGHQHHDHSNYNHHMISPHHHLHHNHHLQQQQSNAFDADFPIGTIKRKPNVMLQPKIPLTNTTRNLALQSDDALLEVNGDDGNDNNIVGGSGGGNINDDLQQYSTMNNNNNNRQLAMEQFQRGTLKTGTLRRSATTTNDESPKNKAKLALLSPQHHHHQIYHQPNPIVTVSIVNNNNNNSSEINNHSDDDLPPPPPPILKEAESTLSLNNASFPPPPSPEMSETSPTPDSISKSGSPCQSDQQQQQPMKPPSMASLPLPPMTPQPQMKNVRLARRLSDLSENSTYFMNYRGNYDNGNYLAIPPNRIYAPNSRASFASSSDSTSFVTLKSNFLNNRRQFQRHNSVDYYQQQQQQQQHLVWDKYGTSPRIRPINDTLMNGNIMNEQFYQQQQPISITNNNHQNYMAFNPSSHNNNNNNNSTGNVVGNSHCSIISDTTTGINNSKRIEYDIPPARVKIFNSQSTTLQQFSQIVPPPPSSSMNYSTNFTPTNSPCHQANNNNNNRPAIKQENHYMSISPHLLQKHQQMLRHQQQQQQQQPPVDYNDNNVIYSGQQHYHHHNNNDPNQLPYHLPEDLFLKNMERVMQKKWHVAQRLQQDQTSTPGQVLGFRDSAYLPPPPSDDSYPNMMPAPPPPPSTANHHYNQSYNHNHHQQQQQYNLATTNHQNSSMIYQSTIPSSPYHMANTNNNNGIQLPKSVQFSDNIPIHSMTMENSSSLTSMTSPMHQPNFNMLTNGGQHQQMMRSKIPPPPPKRSESTQLTTAPNRR